MFHLLYWIFCFSFALDFRGEGGGNPAQYVFLAAAVASAGLMILTTPGTFAIRPTMYLTGAWWIYLGSTVIVMVEARVPASQYLRCLLPPLLCGMGMLVGQAMAARRFGPESLLPPLLWAGIINVIWRFIHAIYITGISISDVRYELLSPTIPLLFAAAVASAVLGKKLNPLAISAASVALLSVIVSVTRSYLFTLAAGGMAAVVCFAFMLMGGAWTGADLRKKLNHFGIAVVVTVLLIVGMFFLNPMMLERWSDRIFRDGGGKTTQEVTYLTRAAEAKAMWHLLEQEPIRFIYGKGLGATYYWDESYFQELLKVYGKKEYINAEQWFPGHSVWTYALFSGGVYALLNYVLLFVWLWFAGLWGAYVAIRNRTGPPELAFLPFIVGLCYFSQTLTANPFGERFSAQILGLCAVLPQFFIQSRQLTSAVVNSQAYSRASLSYPSSPTHRAR